MNKTPDTMNMDLGQSYWKIIDFPWGKGKLIFPTCPEKDAQISMRTLIYKIDKILKNLWSFSSSFHFFCKNYTSIDPNS